MTYSDDEDTNRDCKATVQMYIHKADSQRTDILCISKITIQSTYP